MTAGFGAATAVSVTQSSPQGFFDQSDFVRVKFSGSDVLAHSLYWNVCVVATGEGDINFDGCLFYGQAGGNLGTGVSLVGNMSATPPLQYDIVYNFINPSFWNLSVCILYGNHVQGVQITNGNFTNCGTGISVPGTAAACSQLAIDNSQFACYANAVLIAGTMSNLMVSNTLFLMQVNNANAIGIVTGAAVPFGNISGNEFLAINGATNNTGLALNGDIYGATITGNVFDGIRYSWGIGLANTPTHDVNVQSNVYTNCTTKTINSGTNNTIGGLP